MSFPLRWCALGEYWLDTLNREPLVHTVYRLARYITEVVGSDQSLDAACHIHSSWLHRVMKLQP
jgi:uncharacterized membrane protein